MPKLTILLGSLLLAAPLAAQPLTDSSLLDRFHLPADGLTFIENRGQWPDEVRFLAPLGGVDVWVTDSGLVYDFYERRPIAGAAPRPGDTRSDAAPRDIRRGRVVRVRFEGGQALRAEGRGRRPTYHNYFLGDDPARWASHVPLYTEVVLHDLYEGVSLRLYEDGGVLRQALTVARNADPDVVQVRIEGAEELDLSGTAPLDRAALLGLAEQRPTPSPQPEPLARNSSPSPFAGGRRRYTRLIGGGGLERVRSIAAGADGSIFLAGRTKSGNGTTDFPTDTNPPGYDQQNGTPPNSDDNDGYLAQVDENGFMLYGTYLGGSGFDDVRGLTFKGGNTYLTGITNSAIDFPIQEGAYQSMSGGGDDTFVMQLRPDGSPPEFATFLGGAMADGGRAIAVDSDGTIIVAGLTESTDFPDLGGSPSGSADVFIVRLSSDGSEFVSGTYLGGSGYDEVLSLRLGIEHIYIAGRTTSTNFTGLDDTTRQESQDLFVAMLDSNGTEILGGRYLGGDDSDGGSGADRVGLAVDENDKVYISGTTSSSNFLSAEYVLQGIDDAFVTRLDSDVTNIEFVTVFGGNGIDRAHALDVALDGSIHVAGESTSDMNFPVSDDAEFPNANQLGDAFFIQLQSDGAEIIYGTFLGGSGRDAAYDLVIGEDEYTYVVGETRSAEDFPATIGPGYSGDQDAFAAAYDLIPNEGPVVVGDGIPDTTLAPGGIPFEQDLTVVFDDPDADPDDLTFSCETETNVVMVEPCEDGLLRVIPGDEEGMATVTVTATDPENASAETTFEVTVENTPPDVTSEIQDQLLVLGGTPFTRALNEVFADDDEGQTLTFGCLVEEGTNFVSVDADECSTEDTLRVTPTAVTDEGEMAVVIVTADDGYDVARDTFDVVVRPPPSEYEASLAGLNVVPPTRSGGTGTITAMLDGNTLSVNGSFSGLEEPFVGAELRIASAGANQEGMAPFRTLIPEEENPTTSGTFGAEDNTFALDMAGVENLLGGTIYVVILVEDESTPSPLIRGQVLPSPNDPPTSPVLTAPEDGIVIDPFDANATDLLVTWEGGMDDNTVVYVWELDASDTFDSPMPIRGRNTGQQARTTLTIEDLQQSLIDEDVEPESQVTWYYRVTSTDGSLLSAPSPSRSLVVQHDVNQRPEIAQAIPDTTLDVGDRFDKVLSTIFSDPDGDDLTYRVEGVRPDGPVTADIVGGNVLIVDAVRDGLDTLSVVATDGELEVEDAFIVTVGDPTSNQPPQIDEAIPNTTVVIGGEPVLIALRDYFSDSDGDDADLTFDCVDTPTGIVSLDGCATGILEVGAASTDTGMATVTVIASDGLAESKPNTFDVTVESAPSISFGSVTSSPSQPQTGAPLTVTAFLTNVLDDGTVTLHHRQGGAAGFSALAMTGSAETYEAVIPGPSVTARGVEFFVQATNPNAVAVQSDTSALRVQVSELAYGRSLPEGNTQTGYRLISVPLALDNAGAGAVLDELGEPNDEVWRLFELLPPGAAGDRPAEGAEGQQYREGPGGITLTPGNAFWLIARDGGTFSTGPGSTALTNTPFPVALHRGWNLIGSPFGFDVPVGQVSRESAAPPQLQTYDGEWRNDVSAMEPFTGYALFVTADEDRLVIDPSPETTARPAKTAETGSTLGWAVRIAATVEQARDANNLALTASAATDGPDALDWHEPPPIGEYVSVSFAPPTDGAAPLTVDARPVPDVGTVWPLVVRSNIRGEIDLAFSGLEDVPADFVVWLVDEAAGAVTDLRREEAYAFAGQGTGAPVRMHLVVGTEAFAQSASGFDGTVPTDFQLAQNYPNPFQAVTTIQYGLPRDEHVVLEVFDVVGRRVATLVDEEMEAGYHKAVWGGHGSPSGLASGVYIYRLRAGSFVSTQRMVVVR